MDNYEDAAAVCMNAGTDLDLGYDRVYTKYLPEAVSKGKVSELRVRNAVKRRYFLSQEFDGSSMRLRMLVGDFDPKDKVAYQNYGYEHLNTDEYKVWCICCS